MAATVRALEPESRKRRKALGSAVCRAFRHEWDGHVYEERHRETGDKVWVARLECPMCGTQRVDFMKPKTCEFISRRYFYPQDYQTQMDRDEARRVVFTSMFTST